MKKRAGPETFSMSFLDILACALGGVLMLLLLTFADSSRSTQGYKSAIAEMEERIRSTVAQLNTTTSTLAAATKESEGKQKALAEAVAQNGQLQDVLDKLQADSAAAATALDAARTAGSTAQAALARAQSEVDALREASSTLRQAQASLVGLRGPMGNVAFVFDTSGSMKTPRFGEYKDMLKSWVNHLPMQHFAVLEFDTEIAIFQPNMVDATPENRAAACVFIDAFAADGTTDTLAALQKAFELEGLDTVVLCSDGEPTIPYPQDGGRASSADIQNNIALIEGWLKDRNRSRAVVINCVAMGNYFNAAYGEFLQRVTRDHGGTFIGR